MPEGVPSEKDVVGLIPEVFYDVIARVSAGIPFLVLLLWDKKADFQIPQGGAGTVLLVALGGYLVGLAFSPAAGLFSLAIKLILKWIPLARRQFTHQEILSPTSPLIERSVGIKNRQFGITLAKLAAETVLCENLFIGFIVLIVVNRWHAVAVLSRPKPGFLVAIGTVLLVMVVQRNVVQLGVLDRLLCAFEGDKRKAQTTPRDFAESVCSKEKVGTV